MELSNKDLQHLARLASLSLSEDEAEGLRTELEAILGYVQTLSSAPTNGVEPTSHLHGLADVTRDDINHKSFSQEQVQKLATEFAHGGFRVPKVL